MAESTELCSTAFKDVRAKRIQYYLQDSKFSVPGNVAELEWKDYCPEVFRHLQELQNVKHADYTMILCATDILKEVNSPGKVGRVIVLSTDDRFVIKTLQKSEVKVILETLPKYHVHVTRNPASVMQRLLGLHSVRQSGGPKIYFVVFENPVPLEAKVYDVYHLKGSSQGRTAQKRRIEEFIIHKDSDFNYCFYLNRAMRERLLMQIKSDCGFLEAEGIIEYSLMIGLAMPTQCEDPVDSRFSHSQDSAPISFTSPTRSSVGSSCSNSDTISSCSLQEIADVGLNYADICQEPKGSSQFRFGIATPVRAVRRKISETGTAREPQCFNVTLYFGIVDFYHKFGMRKRIERLYKSIQYDSKSISAMNPQDYSSRFQDFLEQIFQAED